MHEKYGHRQKGEGAMIWGVRPILQMPTSFMPVVITVFLADKETFGKDKNENKDENKE